MTAFSSDSFAKARVIVRGQFVALKPRPRLTLSQWADEKHYLSPDAGASEPGRWKTEPFQRGWMDAMTDRRIEKVTVMKSARIGYTESIKALIGYHVEHDPCPMLLVLPTEDDAKAFSKENIQPLQRDVPSVGDKFARFMSKNTMLLLRFLGGILQIAGARSPGNFRMRSRRVVISDEIDGYPLSSGKEGGPLDLAENRALSYWNRKLVRGSTPTDAGISLVEREFLDGDQRRYYVPCPHCRDVRPDLGMQVLVFKQFKWPDGQPELAVYVCIHCGCEIDESHKSEMIAAGEWRPGPHPQFPDVKAPPPWHGHASFHIWAAYSFLQNTTWGHICAEFVKKNAAGPDALKTVVNTWLGETWVEKGEAPNWRHLYDRRETYAIGTCPEGVLFLTAAVDVQPNRFVYEVVGWGRDLQSWSIDADVIAGDTSDESPNGPWRQVTALLERPFRHACGAELRIRIMAIDSGDQTQTVYRYVQSKPGGRVVAVKGTDKNPDALVTVSTVDVLSVSKQQMGTTLLHKVNTDISKSELHGWLRLQLPTDKERAAGGKTPPGYCRFPEYGEDYFKELTGEQRVTKKDGRGFPFRVWEKIPGRENHHMDVRRYARAAANIVKIDKFRETDWLALEAALAELARTAAVMASKATEPPPEGGAPPAAPASGQSPRRPRTGPSRYFSNR